MADGWDQGNQGTGQGGYGSGFGEAPAYGAGDFQNFWGGQGYPWGGPYPANLGTGYGPEFGGGWATWSGQVGQNFGPGQTGIPEGSELSDQEIERLINRALDNDPLTQNTDIMVKINQHVVTLTGTVRGKHAKMRAGDIAWRAPGVDDVHNQVQIKGRGQQTQQGAQAGQIEQETRPVQKQQEQKTPASQKKAAGTGAS